MWYAAAMVRLVVGCGGVGSRQSSDVASWRLLTRRAWHGWCVACVVVTLPGTHRCCVCTGHVYVGVAVWSGGCGSRRAAKSIGAQPIFVVVACRGGFVLALLWWCMSWNDFAFDSGVVPDSHGGRPLCARGYDIVRCRRWSSTRVGFVTDVVVGYLWYCTPRYALLTAPP